VRRHVLVFVFAFLALGPAVYAQSGDTAASSQQTGPGAPTPCTVNCPQTPAKPATNPDAPAKPAAKPHKVYTNEDMDSRPHDITITGSRDLLQQLNACDRTCFDQVAQRAGINPGSNVRWKMGLLNSIETVKGDVPWQEILGELLNIQGKACETQVQKTQDIQRFADPRSVTPGELAVDRQYEAKFREIRNRLNAALDRANAHIAKNSPDNLQSAYMHMQADKLVHATCTINVPAPPEDTDDPPDP
jgi:hypothetical protein